MSSELQGTQSQTPAIPDSDVEVPLEDAWVSDDQSGVKYATAPTGTYYAGRKPEHIFLEHPNILKKLTEGTKYGVRADEPEHFYKYYYFNGETPEGALWFVEK